MSRDARQGAKIHLEERDGYLYAFVSGENDSLEVSLAYWQKVVGACKQRGFDKLLVEEDFHNQVPLTDMFELCARIADMIAPGGLRIAFVDRELAHQDLNEFGQTVAMNRGIRVRLFTDARTAADWLSN